MTIHSYILNVVGISCAAIFVKHDCPLYKKIWLTTSLLATQDVWCLRLWAIQNTILSVVQVNTGKYYSCNPMDFHAYVKKCKAWYDLYLMYPQLTRCWFCQISINRQYNDKTNGQCVGVNGASWWIEGDKKTGKHRNTHTQKRKNRKNRDNSGIHTKTCRHIVCTYIRQTWLHSR